MRSDRNTTDQQNETLPQDGKWDYLWVFVFSLLWSPVYTLMIPKIEEMGYAEAYTTNTLVGFCFIGLLASAIYWKKSYADIPIYKHRVLYILLVVSVVFVTMLLIRAGLVVKYGL